MYGCARLLLFILVLVVACVYVVDVWFFTRCLLRCCCALYLCLCPLPLFPTDLRTLPLRCLRLDLIWLIAGSVDLLFVLCNVCYVTYPRLGFFPFALVTLIFVYWPRPYPHLQLPTPLTHSGFHYSTVIATTADLQTPYCPVTPRFVLYVRYFTFFAHLFICTAFAVDSLFYLALAVLAVGFFVTFSACTLRCGVGSGPRYVVTLYTLPAVITRLLRFVDLRYVGYVGACYL